MVQLYTNLKLILVSLCSQNDSLTIPTLSQTKRRNRTKKTSKSKFELEFEVKVKFLGLNPHPILHVPKPEEKTPSAPFMVTYIEIHDDPDGPDITYGNYIL